MTDGLDRLTAREREILALLAHGHTAKSVAAQTGSSVASVNERLRQARRKTGVGSSRELARLVAVRKNRDEEIGLPGPVASAPLDRSPSPIVKGAIVMTVLVVVAATAAYFAQPQDVPGAAPQADALAEKILGPAANTPRAISERLRAEPRDPAWADAAEAALRARYAPMAAGRIAVRRIRCGSTVCEMIGAFADTGSVRASRTYSDIQDARQNELSPSVRLRIAGASFGKGGFMTVWERRD